jgi:hypothetical protein
MADGKGRGKLEARSLVTSPCSAVWWGVVSVLRVKCTQYYLPFTMELDDNDGRKSSKEEEEEEEKLQRRGKFVAIRQ